MDKSHSLSVHHTTDIAFTVQYGGMTYNLYISQATWSQNSICGINPRNNTCEIYKLYPIWSDLHNSFDFQSHRVGVHHLEGRV